MAQVGQQGYPNQGYPNQGKQDYYPQQDYAPQQDYTPGMAPYGSGGVHDAEQIIRLGFVRKVYGILCTQLIITAAIIYPFTRESFFGFDLRDYVQQHTWVMYTCFGISFACIIAIVCCGNVARSFPTNYIVLGIFTVAEAITLGIVCSFYESDSVLLAAGMTAALVFGLTLFAFQTKIDFTMYGGMLFVALFVLMLFGMFAAFFVGYQHRRILDIVYCSAGVLIFGLYIVYDTQLMLGNLGGRRHKHSFGVDDYVFAALNLYLDVINLFLMLLRLFGNRN